MAAAALTESECQASGLGFGFSEAGRPWATCWALPPGVLVGWGRVLGELGEEGDRGHLIITRRAEARATLLTITLLSYIFKL